MGCLGERQIAQLRLRNGTRAEGCWRGGGRFSGRGRFSRRAGFPGGEGFSRRGRFARLWALSFVFSISPRCSGLAGLVAGRRRRLHLFGLGRGALEAGAHLQARQTIAGARRRLSSGPLPPCQVCREPRGPTRLSAGPAWSFPVRSRAQMAAALVQRQDGRDDECGDWDWDWDDCEDGIGKVGL